MTLRWMASALSDAKGRFRKLRGYRDMKLLLAALDAHMTQPTLNTLNSRPRSITTREPSHGLVQQRAGQRPRA